MSIYLVVEEPSLADMIQFKYDYKRKKQLITARMVMLVEKEREMKLREKQLEAREEIIFWKENYLRTLINSGVIPPISGFPQLSLTQPEDPKCRPVVTTARCSDYQRTEPSSVTMQRPSNGFLYQKQPSDDWKTPQPIEVRLNPRNAMGNPDLEYHRQLPVGSKELALPSVQASLYRVEKKPFSEGSPPNLLKNEVLEIGPSSKVTRPSNGNLFLGMGRKRGRPKGSKNKNKFARFTDCNQQQKSMPQLIAISPLMRRESDCRVSSQSGLFGVDGPRYRSELFEQRSPAPNFLKVNSTVCAKMNGSANPGTFSGERILPPVTQSKLDGNLFRTSSGFIPASANPASFDSMKANVACDQTRNLLAMAEKSVSNILPPLSPFSSNADNWDEEEEEEEEEEEIEGKVENEKLECRNDVSSSADRYLRGDDTAMMDGSDDEDCESQEGCLVIAEETVEA